MTTARLLLSALLTLTAATAPAQTPLEYRRDILRADRREAVTLVPLDSAVYAATRDGLPDVRIIDDLGREIPFAVRPDVRRRTIADRVVAPSVVTSLEVARDESLEVVTRLDDESREPDGATIHTPLTDFERRVRVLGSSDGKSWEFLAEGRIFDYSRYVDLRQVEIPFRANGHRQFKWIFDRESDEQRSPFYELSRAHTGDDRERRAQTETILRRPFRIDRIALHSTIDHVSGEEPTTNRSRLEVLKVDVDRQDRVTRIELAAERLPLVKLSLLTTSRNFHRPARVQRFAESGWTDVGRGSLSLYQLGGFRREALDLEFAETRSDRLRIVIDDGDNPPLAVAGVEGVDLNRDLAFVAAAGRSYRLEYGSDALTAPRYDADAVLNALGPDAPRDLAGLGFPVANPDYQPSPRRVAVDSSAWLFLALVLMTAVLAWAVLQAVRRADKRPVDEWE